MDGEALVTDIKVAPVIPGSPPTELLYSQGFVRISASFKEFRHFERSLLGCLSPPFSRFQPCWVDLGDLGLASGQQLWVKQDFKPRDVEAIILQEKLQNRE